MFIKDLCGCDPYGSISPICDKQTGQCLCKSSVSGLKCTQCEIGFYNLTSFGCSSKCQCNPIGSVNKTYCNTLSGQCECKVIEIHKCNNN